MDIKRDRGSRDTITKQSQKLPSFSNSRDFNSNYNSDLYDRPSTVMEIDEHRPELFDHENHRDILTFDSPHFMSAQHFTGPDYYQTIGAPGFTPHVEHVRHEVHHIHQPQELGIETELADLKKENTYLRSYVNQIRGRSHMM